MKIHLEEEFRSKMGFEQIIGHGAMLNRACTLLKLIASSDSMVLWLDETKQAFRDQEADSRSDRTTRGLNCCSLLKSIREHLSSMACSFLALKIIC
jgi:transcriptional regulator with GAF, ATPase, and Fis domain